MSGFLIVLVGTTAFVALARWFNNRDRRKIAKRLDPHQRHIVLGDDRLNTSPLR